MAAVDFDKVLVMVGDRGKYQTVMFFILCIPATIPVAFLAFSNVFTNATPDHWCQPPPKLKNLNLSEAEIKHYTIPFRIRGDGEKIYSKCEMYDSNSSDIFSRLLTEADRTFSDSVLRGNSELSGKFDRTFDDSENYSNRLFRLSDEWRRSFDKMAEEGQLKTTKCKYGWVYDKTYYDATLVTELDLVCDNNWLPQTSTALFYVGSLFGNVIFGWVADRWGRRRSMLLMIFLEVIVSIATCFSKDYNTYMIFRAIGGLFFPALYQIPFILGIEMMGPSHRTFAGMLICMFFAVAMSILALLAFLIRDWFRLSIATSVPFLMLFSYYWIIPESPRWLLSRGRLDEAEEILQTMARYNGTKIPKRLLHQLHEEANATSSLISAGENKKSNTPKNGILKGSDKVLKNIILLDNVSSKSTKESETYYGKKCDSEPCGKRRETGNDMAEDETELRKPENLKWTRRPSTYPLKNTALENMHLNHINQARDEKGNEDVKKVKCGEKNTELCDEDNRNERRSSDIIKSDCGIGFKCVRNMKSIYLQTSSGHSAEKQEATMFDIFRYPNIRKKFFLLTFDWIANAVVYNGLSYNATSLGVNDFLAFFIAAAIEIPSSMLSWWFMDRWGRRWVLCIALATGGIGCLCCMFVPEERVWITVAFAMIGKFGIAASFSVFYVFVGELFPTVLRSQAMGLSSLLVSVGLLSFPYILQLSHYSRVLPLIILGILSLSASVVSLFLPETLNMPMPQSLEDGENFGKNFKIFSMPKRRTKTDCET